MKIATPRLRIAGNPITLRVRMGKTSGTRSSLPFSGASSSPNCCLLFPSCPCSSITSLRASVYVFPHLGHFIPVPHSEFQCILPAQPKFLFIYEVFLGRSLLKFPCHSKCVFNMVPCLPCIVIVYTLVWSLLCMSLLCLLAQSSFVGNTVCLQHL